jgi:hypothetical protein
MCNDYLLVLPLCFDCKELNSLESPETGQGYSRSARFHVRLKCYEAPLS